MNRSTRTLMSLLVAIAFACTLGACNTMSGLGKDTQKAGEKIEDEAERHIDDDDSAEDAGDRGADARTAG